MRQPQIQWGPTEQLELIHYRVRWDAWTD